MQVIEDFESRPHKAITYVVERGRERQEWNEQKLPKALLGQWRKVTREMHGRERQRERRIMHKKANKDRRNMRKSKKELEAHRGRSSKDKTPYQSGIARRLRMKKKVGKKATKWQNNGKRSHTWMT